MQNEHKCISCFYAQHDKNLNPCNVCEGYNKYVNRNIYINQPDTITIRSWDNEDIFTESKHDVVNAPKHYMLIPEKNIEVRDVLNALVEKIHKAVKEDDYPQFYSKPMFESDYVQMMQYGMRFMEKNGLEDLKKMRWYLDRCIEDHGTNT